MTVDTAQPLEEHLDTGPAGASDPAWRQWKEQKVKKALKQAEDRASLKPAKEVWEEFGFER